jgi:hypothetical protein
MRGVVAVEEEIAVGKPVVVESRLSDNVFAAFFEDDGDTGYFYGVDTTNDEPILDALHIYNVGDVTDSHLRSNVKIVWSTDGLKTALSINDYIHAVFDFEMQRGYCRTGFPPINDWSRNGHDWSDEAIELFS